MVTFGLGACAGELSSLAGGPRLAGAISEMALVDPLNSVGGRDPSLEIKGIEPQPCIAPTFPKPAEVDLQPPPLQKEKNLEGGQAPGPPES